MLKILHNARLLAIISGILFALISQVMVGSDDNFFHVDSSDNEDIVIIRVEEE